MQLESQGILDICYAALSLHSQPLRLRLPDKIQLPGMPLLAPPLGLAQIIGQRLLRRPT
jgi:hypothetical protein